MKTLYSSLIAIAALGVSSFLITDLALAAADPLTMRQQDLNQLLRQQRLDELQREQQINRLHEQQRLDQVQRQLNQIQLP